MGILAVSNASAHAKSAAELLYRKPSQGSQSHPNPEFVIPVNSHLLETWKNDHGSIAVSQVVEMDQVLMNRTGARSGMLEKPSKQQLMDTFGSCRFEEVFSYMAEHGSLQPAGTHADVVPSDRPNYPRPGVIHGPRR